MKYINLNTLAYPVTEMQIRQAAEPVSLPGELYDETLAEYGFAKVIETPKPTPKIYQSVTEAQPELISGEWRQKWQVNTPALADCKAIILRQLNNACEARLAPLKAGYPSSEVASWPKQEMEARAYLADASSNIPLVTSIAASRGIPVPVMVDRIMQKSDLWAITAGSIIGTRQALEDDLNDADEETIDLVVWPD